MRTNTSLTTPPACGRHPFNLLKGNIHHLIPTSSHHLIIFMLSSFSLLLSPLSAQVDKKIILNPDSLQKNELIITPELEEAVVTKIKNRPDYFGIKNKEQLENLHLGKPIPWYSLVNEQLESVDINSVSRMSDGEHLSLSFTNYWNVPIMSDEEPLLFGLIMFLPFVGNPAVDRGIENTTAHFYNFEHKDSIIGSVGVNFLNRGMDFLIIRKDNKVLFVQVYDEATGKFFKNEYSFSELINPIKEISLREKEARERSRDRYYAFVADKSELILTPELTEMLCTRAYSSHINDSDEMLAQWGIKNRAQLEHLQFEKPIPLYEIVNETLTFTGKWLVIVMSDNEPLFTTYIKLEEDGQYRDAGSGSGGRGSLEALFSYEHKDLITGGLSISGRGGYLIIRKDKKDIFVKYRDEKTGELLKGEYSLNEIINLYNK